jgi:hypothetical protein
MHGAVRPSGFHMSIGYFHCHWKRVVLHRADNRKGSIFSCGATSFPNGPTALTLRSLEMVSNVNRHITKSR